MRWVAMLAFAIFAAVQAGCQNFGGSGYPMQSVTRVPPPATGSYPVGGNYYNSPAGAQSSISPISDSSTNIAGVSNMAQPLETQPQPNRTVIDPSVSPAQYTQPATNYPGEGINNIPTLQWQ